MNCQNKLVWQLGSVHKIHVHLEATSPLNFLILFLVKCISRSHLDGGPAPGRRQRHLQQPGPSQ